ncbi:hypothetical protein EVAR_74315_1 [Eumeta japonica]|uniref:Uncharacterized protein n=1 Tax=Eumeta variegata TaxID=151549 RepID=A0A4C1SD50_EUMVA|nr:hypothetical protein EVAR_74315_1 [Eumeta japonica]
MPCGASAASSELFSRNAFSTRKPATAASDEEGGMARIRQMQFRDAPNVPTACNETESKQISNRGSMWAKGLKNKNVKLAPPAHKKLSHNRKVVAHSPQYFRRLSPSCLSLANCAAVIDIVEEKVTGGPWGK